MIPKLKPYYDIKELKAAFRFEKDAIPQFEKEFAKQIGMKYALAFPYGRSCLYAFLKAMEIQKAEVLMPAYSCVVAANATVLSGNRPRFSDINIDDYNMDLQKAKRHITKRTKVIVPTSLFGYPVNLNQLQELKTKDLWVFHDSALGYLATYKGKSVAKEGDVALFSLGIGKQLSTLCGGVLTTDNEEIYNKVKDYRHKNFKKHPFDTIKKISFFIAQFLALNNLSYNLTYFLWKKKIITFFTQYYNENKIELPNNFYHYFTNFQARIGLEQLRKLPEIIERRKKIARYYNTCLGDLKGIALPPIIEGATYSHYVPKILKRWRFIEEMAKRGVHVGHHFEYSIPDLKAYKLYKDREFTNASFCAKRAVNIPNYPDLTKSQQDYIIEKTREVISLIGPS